MTKCNNIFRMGSWDRKRTLIKNLEKNYGEFPGGPMVRTPCCHCQRPGFDPWAGN